VAREVVWTEPAWEDLEAAAEFIARDSEHYAAAFVREVREAAESLGEFAHRGQIVPELRDPATRELLVRPYRLVYRVGSSQVTIIAVIHGARRARRL
jgi:plasmid stabilization system protein ParE